MEILASIGLIAIFIGIGAIMLSSEKFSDVVAFIYAAAFIGGMIFMTLRFFLS